MFLIVFLVAWIGHRSSSPTWRLHLKHRRLAQLERQVMQAMRAGAIALQKARAMDALQYVFALIWPLR